MKTHVLESLLYKVEGTPLVAAPEVRRDFGDLSLYEEE